MHSVQPRNSDVCTPRRQPAKGPLENVKLLDPKTVRVRSGLPTMALPGQIAMFGDTAPTPTISSISPSSVGAGSRDVTITDRALGTTDILFGALLSGRPTATCMTPEHGCKRHSQLTAVIPARLLQNPTSVQIVVMNGDVMGMSDGYFGYPRSNPVTLT